MSSGREEKDGPALLTRSTSTDYEQLCALDVLGLADTHENDQQAVYKEFKEQLVRDEAGWYQTSLPWKGNHPPLPMNETGSKKRTVVQRREMFYPRLQKCMIHWVLCLQPH